MEHDDPAAAAPHIKEEFREEYLRLKELVAMGPRNPEPYLDLGDICFFSGASDEAKRWYKTAALVSNRSPEVMEHISMHMPLAVEEREEKPFVFDWDNVLKYPLRNGAWLGVVFAGLGIFATYFALMFAAIFAFSFVLVVYMLLSAHLLKVVQDTAHGGKSLPRLFGESFDFFGDVARPALSFWGAVLFYFIFPFLLIYFAGKLGLPVSGLGFAKVFPVYFSIIFPGVMGACALGGFLVAVNPVILVKIISRTFLTYMLAVAALALINSGVSALFRTHSLKASPLLFLTVVSMGTAYVYYLTAHIIGRIFRDNAEKLGI